MRLSEYLKERGENESQFARRAGLPQRTINRICNGQGCRAETAAIIIRASTSAPTSKGGIVSLEGLLPRRRTRKRRSRLDGAGAAA